MQITPLAVGARLGTGGIAERKLLWALAAITLVGAAIRLSLIDDQSMWTDEFTWFRIANRPYVDIFFHSEGWAPLYGLMARSLHLLGLVSDAALRLPSAIAGIAAIPVAYVVFRRLQDGVVALLATTLLALHPMAVWYSVEHGVYSLLMLCALLSTFYLLRLLEKPTRADRIAFGVIAFLGCGLHYLFVFVLVPQGLIALWDMIVAKERRVAWLWTAAAVAVAFLMIMPALIGDLSLRANTEGKYDLPIQSIALAPGYTVLAFTGGLSFGPGAREVHDALQSGGGPAGVLQRYAIELVLAVIAFTVPAVIALTGKWDRRRAISLIMMAGPSLLALLGAFFLYSYRPRYSFMALPFFLLWVASSIRGRFSKGAIGALVILLLVQIYGLWHINDPRYVREDNRSAAAYIEANDPEIAVLPVGMVTVIHYLEDQDRVYELPVFTDLDLDEVRRRIMELSADSGRLWLVVSRPWIIRGHTEILDFLDQNFDQAESAEFPGIKVVKLLRKER